MDTSKLTNIKVTRAASVIDQLTDAHDASKYIRCKSAILD